MPWFTARKFDLPTPPPEPPPSAAARKAKEQGWLDSIRSKRRGLAAVQAQGSPALGGSDESRSAAGLVGTLTRQQSALGMQEGINLSSAELGSRTLMGRPSVSSISRFGIRNGASQASPAAEFGSLDHPAYYSTPVSPSQECDEDDSLAVATKSLAQRLQELATAKEDGLLDDEEYRVLRKGVFEHIASTSVHKDPMLGSDTGERFPGQKMPLSQSPTSVPTSPRHLAPPRHNKTPSFRGSLRSTRSTASFFTNIFKRHSRSHLEAVDWEDGVSSSARDSASLHNGHASSIRSELTHTSGSQRLMRHNKIRPRDYVHTTSPKQANSESGFRSQYLDATSPRSRSIRVRPELQALTVSSNSTRSVTISTRVGSSAASCNSGTTDSQTPHSPPKSSATTATSTYSRSNRLLSPCFDDEFGEESSSSSAPPIHDPNAAELRREISDLEYECCRVIETFRDMERAAYTKYHGCLPASSGVTTVCGIGGGGVSNRAVVNMSLGGVGDLDSGSGDLVDFNGNGGRPVSFLAPLASAATLRHKSSKGLMIGRGNSTKSGSGSAHHYNTTRSPDETLTNSTFSNLVTPFSDTTTSPIRNHQQQHQDILSSPKESTTQLFTERDPQTESALEREVSDIRARKRAVEEKYEKRLEYLRAKLKGAMIREKLIR